MIDISKIGCENFLILEISYVKSHNSGSSLDETWVLMISAKHLLVNGINPTNKESSTRKLWQPIMGRILLILDKLVIIITIKTHI